MQDIVYIMVILMYVMMMEHVKLQQGETMDYMYMPYEEFIDFIMSERFIPSEQRRFKLHSEHIVKQIKQACMLQ